jgi:cell shape-determining protein MreC
LAAAEARWRTVQLDTATLVTLEKENQLLRAALQWQQAHRETVYAWKGSGTTWWMAAGCKEGVKEGEAVVHDHTIIGTVQRVGQQESAVATVADPDWRLAVVIGTASAQGVFMTQRGTPSVEEIAPHMPVAVGEIVTTAGQAGVPRGLIVGKVMAILAENSQATKTAIVDLALPPSAANWVQLAGGETRRSTCP